MNKSIVDFLFLINFAIQLAQKRQQAFAIP